MKVGGGKNMIRVRFAEFSYPKGLGLKIVSEYLSDQQMEDLIIRYRDLPRKQRRIILPGILCVRKVFLHYVWQQVLAGRNWKKIRKELKPFGGTLVRARTSQCQVRNCYLQREREIARESK